MALRTTADFWFRIDARGRVAVLLLLLVGGGCGKAPPREAPRKEEPLAGVALTLVVDPASPLRDALPLRLAEWEARTGSTVAVRTDRSAGESDVRILSGHALTSVDLPPLPPERLKDDHFDIQRLPAVYRNVFTRHGDATIALPLAGDIVLLWYRADLLDDPKLAGDYAKAYGRPLRPPDTWQEFARIAEFLQKQGTVPYGCVEATQGADGVRNFLVRAASYVKGPNWSSFVVDTETGAARIAGAGFRRGLADWLAAVHLAPPAAARGLDAASARRLFREGQAAFLVDRLPPTVDPDRRERGKFDDVIAVAALPGAATLVHPRTGAVQELEKPNRCVHFATTGWYAVLGPNPPPAAVRLLLFLAEEAESHYLAQGARHGLLPVHPVLLAEPARFGGYGLSAAATARYFELYQQGLNANNWVTDLRTSDAPALLAVLDEHLQEAIAGKAARATALERAESRWNSLIEPKQRDFRDEYRQSLGLPRIAEP
jgi:multiple sugar transport system substrate-binding protein